MAYAARVVCDSISCWGDRLTTFEVTIPRIVLAEFNTHRMLTRSSASSRAIPVEKRIEMVTKDPFVPTAFAKNRKGMQSTEDLESKDDAHARYLWLNAKDQAVRSAEALSKMGVHKALANRLLEPFLWHTILCQATEWLNYFGLRLHKNAQPEIRIPTEMMWEAYNSSTPVPCGESDWHLPLVRDHDQFDLEVQGQNVIAICTGRCARVSYLTHNGERDPSEDIRLHDQLLANHHMSPFEFPASVMTKYEMDRDPMCGNLRGWKMYRKRIRGEAIFTGDGT